MKVSEIDKIYSLINDRERIKLEIKGLKDNILDAIQDDYDLTIANVWIAAFDRNEYVHNIYPVLIRTLENKLNLIEEKIKAFNVELDN